MTLRRLRIPTMVALVAALAATASGCGSDKPVTKADSSATYLDLNHLKYQVQVSRELNPHDPEDANYLIGLAPGDQRLAPSQAWFGVFLTVYNRTDQSHLAASDFKIVDTQGAVYTPVGVQRNNPIAYRQRNVSPNDQIPRQGSIGFYGPTSGALLIFKVNLTSFDNRPLELRIADPVDPSITATEPLDL